ncbi:RING-box protein 2 isoform X1 [Histomonas meleagridis]|uniref:RING-box protein 2 isoform X1 n=1 Tax=Histomonas meleagridis TaxID=135588 RepID=UPI00355AAB04|nr:RING-box protein 2 isoform X1 [Histomonas meleagridis]KAH0800354.1 RING-box protein 2 isoform X1 [Histomonas meleagridis]
MEQPPNQNQEQQQPPKPAPHPPQRTVPGARPPAPGARPTPGARPLAPGARPPAPGARPAGAPGQRPPVSRPGASGAPAGEQKIQYHISKFLPVYLVSWEGNQDTCSICHSNLIAPCYICEAESKTEPCPLQEGQCSHVFHLHCISKWIQSNNSNCPVCNKEWVVKTNS